MYKFSLFVAKCMLLFSFISCTSSSEDPNGLAAKIEEKYEKFKGYFKVHTHREHVAEYRAQEELERSKEDAEYAQKDAKKDAQKTSK